MPDPGEPALSLSEWLVLCLVAEQPTHGQAIATLLGQDGALGRVWRVHKPVIYRCLQRLEQHGLVAAAGVQPSTMGPDRLIFEVTPGGRAVAARWLRTPVAHARDIRSELLIKLALLEREGSDPRGLLTAQHAGLEPIAAALTVRLDAAAGFERTMLLWRLETISATIRFLEALQRAPAARGGLSG